MNEFDKAIEHVKACLFWDFVDGQWLDKLYTPLDRDFFNRLMQGVVETHETENAKLREQIHWLEQGDILHVLTDAELAERQKHEREMQASITALNDENAKLREFLQDTLMDADDYAKKYGISPYFTDITEHLDIRMRELGFEVPE